MWQWLACVIKKPEDVQELRQKMVPNQQQMTEKHSEGKPGPAVLQQVPVQEPEEISHPWQRPLMIRG